MVAQAVKRFLRYGSISGSIEGGLEFLCKFCDMQTVRKGVVHLHCKRQKNFSAAFAVASPVKEGRDGVALARNGVRNVRVAEPRQGRKLKHVVFERAGKLGSLFFGGLFGYGNVFAQGGEKRYAHHLEQFRLLVEPSEGRIDFVEEDDVSVQKAVAEFLDFIRAFCRGMNERKG